MKDEAEKPKPKKQSEILGKIVPCDCCGSYGFLTGGNVPKGWSYGHSGSLCCHCTYLKNRFDSQSGYELTGQ